MTRKEFATEMTKYAMRDPNNHRDDYGISLVQNEEGILNLWITQGKLFFNSDIDLSMFDPNEEVNKEYIGMLCKVMAQLGLAAMQTDFVAQVKGEGRKAEKADDRKFMLQVYLFRILLASILDMLESTVAERCL